MTARTAEAAGADSAGGLKSPIHERGRLVFWDGQDRQNSIAGRLRERLAAYRAAHAAG